MKILIPVLFLVCAGLFGVLLGVMEKEVYKDDDKQDRRKR